VLGEAHVLVARAHVVGVPGDLDAPDLRVLPEHLGDQIERLEAARPDDALAPEFEVDVIVDDHDLVAPDLDLHRHDVGAAVSVVDAVHRLGHVGASVGVVRDAVVIAIGIRAAVGLRIGGLDAGLLGAGVLAVGDGVAVGVAVGAAEVAPGCPDDVTAIAGARVVAVEDPVAIPVERPVRRSGGEVLDRHHHAGEEPEGGGAEALVEPCAAAEGDLQGRLPRRQLHGAVDLGGVVARGPGEVGAAEGLDQHARLRGDLVAGAGAEAGLGPELERTERRLLPEQPPRVDGVKNAPDAPVKDGLQASGGG
jgi:hypothetical protein